MKVSAMIADLAARTFKYLRTRPLRWYVLLLVVCIAGPMGADIAVLLDLYLTVGIDVVALSMLYYVSGSLVEATRIAMNRVNDLLLRQGGVPLNRAHLASPASVALHVGHNLCALVTARRFYAIGIGFFAICMTLSLSGGDRFL
jgi:hypothetical protein